jgi:hypothetical protein
MSQAKGARFREKGNKMQSLAIATVLLLGTYMLVGAVVLITDTIFKLKRGN